MNKRSGFTLIELMIVVGIIAIICAIAVPNLLRSRIQANEAATIEDLRAITGAQITYNTTHQSFTSLDALADNSAGPSYLDTGWKEGRIKNGYVFSIPAPGTGNFVCFADPVVEGVSGNRFFRVDISGVIRFKRGGQPTETDPSVGG